MINLSKVRTYPLRERKSKVKIIDFAQAYPRGIKTREFLNSLPKILAGKDFRNLVKLILFAKKKKKPIIFMCGAHIIKCGLSPLLIDLMRRSFVNLLALNGAGPIHDFEIAYQGQTSEEVAENIEDGRFGMAKETAEFLNQTISEGSKKNIGIGLAIGQRILEKKLPYREHSILAQAVKLKIPVTVHIAVGTDIIYQHPSCNAGAWGEASHHDFLRFTEEVSLMGDGGVVLNFGSAVILPEVFLKALNLARNLGYKVKNFAAANFDLYDHYRPRENVAMRPTGGKGYIFLGHHEFLFPLLHRALIEFT